MQRGAVLREWGNAKHCQKSKACISPVVPWLNLKVAPKMIRFGTWLLYRSTSPQRNQACWVAGERHLNGSKHRWASPERNERNEWNV